LPEQGYGPVNFLFPVLLLAMHSRPGLAQEMENLGTLFSNISAAVKGMQTSLNVFHAALRSAATARPDTAPDAAARERPAEELKETVQNLEALFDRMKNNGG